MINDAMFRYWDTEKKKYVMLDDKEVARVKAECEVSQAVVEELFEITNDTHLMSVADLMPSRARIDGIISASRRMLEAKAGKRTKRLPISVRFDPATDQYVLLDGNSTYFVCLLWGINEVPCSVDSH